MINAAISATGSRSSPIKPHLTNDIADPAQSRVDLVGDTVGIVYGPACSDLRRLFGASHWISSVACLHNSAGTDFCSADCSSAGWLLIPVVLTAAESKRDVFDIYTIIFLALAVFIFLRLRSVLGQRTGRERPPYDPYSARDAVRGSTTTMSWRLPGRGGEPPPPPAAPVDPAERWKGIAEPGSRGRRRPQCHRAGGSRPSTPSISSPARGRPTR